MTKAEMAGLAGAARPPADEREEDELGALAMRICYRQLMAGLRGAGTQARRTEQLEQLELGAR